MGTTVFNRELPLDFVAWIQTCRCSHWRQDGATYFVTFRLNDALPQAKIDELQQMKRELEAAHPSPRSPEGWHKFAQDVSVKAERWLDEGYGSCLLANPANNKLLTDGLAHFNQQRYLLSCYTIMPNHCHAIIQPFSGFDLEKILQVCKGFVARQINKLRRTNETVWQEESYDRIIRDAEHLYNVIQYIGRNPKMAGIDKTKWIRWIEPTWARIGWDFEE